MPGGISGALGRHWGVLGGRDIIGVVGRYWAGIRVPGDIRGGTRGVLGSTGGRGDIRGLLRGIEGYQGYWGRLNEFLGV